jgi:asparagine synthase (glutamine-hydrolysing)
MCGIAGLISTKPMQNLNIYDLATRLRHRGPDNWGYYIEPLVKQDGVGRIESGIDRYLLDTGYEWNPESGLQSRSRYLAYLDKPLIMMLHTRLSILDLSPAGNQPMLYNRGDFVLVFNGEIYNYPEIRAKLQSKGYSFTTGTDSEVVLAAYQEWGQECIHHFNGMWAFSIYDRPKQQIFISRDRLGVKPLFYTYSQETGYFAFASEIKALLALPSMRAEANREVCQSYLLYDCVENTSATFFKNIYRLPPASNLTINLACIKERGSSWKQAINIARYWNLQVNNEGCVVKEKDMASKKEEFYDLFTDAVRIRLRADVRVGTALSGGLDSSSNVYVINQLLKQGQAGGVGDRQYSFSSVFPRTDEKYADESPFIDLITRQLDINPIKVIPGPERLLEEIESVVYHQDEPFGSTSIFAQWCVFSLPRPNGVLVTLDGQGADEQLAGYPPYLSIYWSDLAIYDPRLYREIWQARDINGGLKAGVRQLLVDKAKNIGLSSMLNNMLLKRHRSMATGIFGENAPGVLQQSMESRPELINIASQTLNEKLAFDTQNGLAVLLRYADRNSMAYGVESRAPYLDYRLAEFLAALPADYKIHNGWTKYIARSAFAGKLPDEITWRRDKMGFPTPEKNWLAGSLREWAIEILSKADILPRLGVKKNIIDDYDKLADDFTLWRLLNMELWGQVFQVQMV